MIPRKIHYCWLSREPFPKAIQTCMDSWKAVMPDYEWVRWDESRFDIRSVPFVEEAYQARKWAFAADYIRLHALYEEGGIYLDTDVIVKQRFDRFLADRFFSSVEYHADHVKEHDILDLLHPDGTRKDGQAHVPGICIQAAIMGSEQGHPFPEACMSWYRERHFKLSDNPNFTNLLAPDIYAMVAAGYGFKYVDCEQRLNEGVQIYPSTCFASTPNCAHAKAYAVHYCLGSWRDAALVSKKLKRGARKKTSLMKSVLTLSRWRHSVCMSH